MKNAQTTTSTQTAHSSTSQFESELVNAIRDGKLVQVRYCDLTESEKRQAYVAFFHQGGW